MEISRWTWARRLALLVLTAAACLGTAAAQDKWGVLVLHGKNPGSANDPSTDSLIAKLQATGAVTLKPDMPWSRTRYLDKPLDGALAEMDHFGLHPVVFFAVAVIAFELTASAMAISGFMRWAGALALAGFTLMATFIALRFWEMAPGMDRMMAINAFFEHLGLAGAFVFVAAFDLTKGAAK